MEVSLWTSAASHLSVTELTTLETTTSGRHQKCATSSETGFTKGALQGNLCLLSLAASIQPNNDIKDPLHDVRPGRTADLASPSLDETTPNSN